MYAREVRDLAAIIVTHNSSDEAVRCAESLARTSNSLRRVLIVDSGSDPEQTELLQSANFTPEMPPIKVVKTENVGYAAALNIGIRELKVGDDDLLLLCNADIIFHLGSVDAMADVVRYGEVDIVGPRILTGQRGGSRVWSQGGRLHTVLGYTTMNGRFPRRASAGKSLNLASFVPGAVWLLGANTFSEAGPLREDLFMYFEDAEFLLRCRAKGLRVGCLDSATVWHKVGGSSGEEGKSLLFFSFMQRNRLLVFGEKSIVRRLTVLLSPYTLFLLLWGWLEVPKKKHYLRCMGIALRDGLQGQSRSSFRKELFL